MHRTQVCNIVVFYVLDWAALGMNWAEAPNTATVTLTRRGTLTLRLTWDGVEWGDNDSFLTAIGLIREFVRGLVY